MGAWVHGEVSSDIGPSVLQISDLESSGTLGQMLMVFQEMV